MLTRPIHFSIPEYFCLHKKFLVYNLVTRNLKVKYRRSFFGFLWTLLIPLSQAAIYDVVFQSVLKVKIENYVPFILSGVMFWIFFSSTLSECIEALLVNANLITKIPIPIQCFALVPAITHVINLLLALPVVAIACLASGIYLNGNSLFVFVCVLYILVIAYAIGLILSVGIVFFRDLRYVLNLVLQVWMYATPILYNENMLPDHLRWILWLNPIGMIFPMIHRVVIEAASPSIAMLFVPLVWAFVLTAAAKLTLGIAMRRGVREWL